MGVLELAKVLYLGHWNTPGGATPDVWDIKIISVGYFCRKHKIHCSQQDHDHVEMKSMHALNVL